MWPLCLWDARTSTCVPIYMKLRNCGCWLKTFRVGKTAFSFTILGHGWWRRKRCAMDISPALCFSLGGFGLPSFLVAFLSFSRAPPSCLTFPNNAIGNLWAVSGKTRETRKRKKSEPNSRDRTGRSKVQERLDLFPLVASPSSWREPHLQIPLFSSIPTHEVFYFSPSETIGNLRVIKGLHTFSVSFSQMTWVCHSRTTALRHSVITPWPPAFTLTSVWAPDNLLFHELIRSI